MSREIPNSPVEKVRWVGRSAIVDVVGDIDLSRSVDFQQVLLGILDESPERMVINLAQVPYMDSSGVASLVKLLSRSRRQNVRLALVSMTERVRSLFEITRLDSVFDIRPTEEEALA